MILPREKGFTLIELMVAIAIVAILAVVGLVVYGDVQKKARDARRTQDIRAIAEAMETNKPVGGVNYTKPDDSWFAGGVIPTDPKTGTQEYCIWLNAPVSGAPVAPPTPPTSAVSPAGINWNPGGGACGGVTSTAGSQKVQGGAPAWSPVVSWTICAKLESVTNGVTCITSKY